MGEVLNLQKIIESSGIAQAINILSGFRVTDHRYKQKTGTKVFDVQLAFADVETNEKTFSLHHYISTGSEF